MCYHLSTKEIQWTSIYILMVGTFCNRIGRTSTWNQVRLIMLTMHVVAEIYPTMTSVDQWTLMDSIAYIVLFHICKLLANSDFTSPHIFKFQLQQYFEEVSIDLWMRKIQPLKEIHIWFKSMHSQSDVHTCLKMMNSITCFVFCRSLSNNKLNGAVNFSVFNGSFDSYGGATL